ncbi:transcriptional regulator [Oleomonas cavernae]|uniref:Transcriptional regulator n=2 Tax=Oleomonas cavernae TaxID=2320859 RepID=A0A418WIY2_9PROT|nr:transcriptional regulator [Oleomonas cavernae]
MSQRVSFADEAAAAWAEYQETGLHLTQQEIETWLDSWGTDAETEVPRCHK